MKSFILLSIAALVAAAPNWNQDLFIRGIPSMPRGPDDAPVREDYVQRPVPATRLGRLKDKFSMTGAAERESVRKQNHQIDLRHEQAVRMWSDKMNMKGAERAAQAKAAKAKAGGPTAGGPKASGSKASGPKAGGSTIGGPKASGPKASGPKAAKSGKAPK